MKKRMSRKRTKKRSFFIPFAAGYAIVALVAGRLFATHMDEAMIALILFGLFPMVILAWTFDALQSGEMWRQGPRSLTSSLTLNERKVTRRDNPLSFWSMLALSWIFALAIIAFITIGIYIRLTT
jgi:hypothetical protein